MRILISEDIQLKKDSNFLYHGTHIRNLNDIKKYGLLPDFGDTVKTTEMYQYYMDDEYFNPDDRVEGILFFSDNPDTWSYSHYKTKPNVDEAVLVIIEKNDTIYQKKGFNFYDIDGNKVDSVNYIDIDKLPPFIEDGDFFSFEEQEPLYILYGQDLIKFLKR